VEADLGSPMEAAQWPFKRMRLLLAIETSSNQYRVILGRDGDPIFDSARESGCSSSRTLAGLLSCGLTVVNAQATDIMGVAVNLGPGRLTHLRAGVSFVNAFAFSLGISIHPFNSFEIIANQARELTTLPVLCAVPAANDHAYVSLINGISVEIMRFGPLRSAVAEISDGLSEVAVAGSIRDRLSSLLNRAKIFDTGIEKPDANVLLELGYQACERGSNSATQVGALNDQSEIFYEPTAVRH
jgi:tRNA threonylcarbamoyladenosine biosynthesis protein TsaB